jgi:hypothetical protein
MTSFKNRPKWLSRLFSCGVVNPQAVGYRGKNDSLFKKNRRKKEKRVKRNLSFHPFQSKESLSELLNPADKDKVKGRG